MADASTQRSLGVMGEKRGCRGLMAQEGVGFTHTHTPTHSGVCFRAGVARSHTEGSEGGGENKELPSSLQKFSKQINCNRKRFADTKWRRWPGVLWCHCRAAGGRRRSSLLVFAAKRTFFLLRSFCRRARAHPAFVRCVQGRGRLVKRSRFHSQSSF